MAEPHASPAPPRGAAGRRAGRRARRGGVSWRWRSSSLNRGGTRLAAPTKIWPRRSPSRPRTTPTPHRRRPAPDARSRSRAVPARRRRRGRPDLVHLHRTAVHDQARTCAAWQYVRPARPARRAAPHGVLGAARLRIRARQPWPRHYLRARPLVGTGPARGAEQDLRDRDARGAAGHQPGHDGTLVSGIVTYPVKHLDGDVITLRTATGVLELHRARRIRGGEGPTPGTCSH